MNKKLFCGKLQTLAQEAKSRLKNGFWTNVRDEKEVFVNKAVDKGLDEKKAKDDFYMNISLDIRNRDDKSEKFYQRVCEILSCPEFILNPIGQLIDKNTYENLNIEMRQHYIFELSRKFNLCKERYIKEQQLKNQVQFVLKEG